MAVQLSSGKSKGVMPNMNVTPLVDVVLVLLIIFMVVTPLLTKQFWLNLPKDEKSENTPPPPKDADQPVAEGLEQALDRALNEHPLITVADVVAADVVEGVPERLKQLLARLAGARRQLRLATEQETRGEEARPAEQDDQHDRQVHGPA